MAKLLKVVEFDLEEIAQFIAEGYADNQAEFFNLLGEKIQMTCGSQFEVDYQIRALVDDLDTNGKELIINLYESLMKGIDHEETD